jgi:AcrR family transcriptional regulator
MRELASDAILEAAEQVFGEVGHEARMEVIASRAGVAVGTLYNHFRDRDALVDALFEHRRAALLARVEAAITESESTPFRARLVLVLEAVLTSTAPNARFRQLFLQAELRKPSKQAMLEHLSATFAPLMAQGRRENLLRSDPHELQAAFLFSLLHTAVLMSYDFPERLPRERVAEIVCDQFVDGACSAK